MSPRTSRLIGTTFGWVSALICFVISPPLGIAVGIANFASDRYLYNRFEKTTVTLRKIPKGDIEGTWRER